VAFDLEFKKIHDLAAILKTCEKKDSSFSQLTEECRYLQKFYIETRYPVVWESKYTKEDALKAQEATQAVKKFVEEKLELASQKGAPLS